MNMAVRVNNACCLDLPHNGEGGEVAVGSRRSSFTRTRIVDCYERDVTLQSASRGQIVQCLCGESS
jgi:hypothetical protein